jgi:hypothetical protein
MVKKFIIRLGILYIISQLLIALFILPWAIEIVDPEVAQMPFFKAYKEFCERLLP